MYGPGNYASQVGQGPYSSRPPFQQRPPGPPPPPPFQQGPLAPRPPVYQHGPLPFPPQIGQTGHPSYRHVSPGPPQHGPPLPIPSSGMSSSQSYSNPHLPPPPRMQAHGGSQVPQYYSTSHPQSQWAQNVHHIPPVVPSPVSGNALPPPTPGQALYRGQVPACGMQVIQQASPTPPPLSSSSPPPPISSHADLMPQHPHISSTTPTPPQPPLPSSPLLSPPHPPVSPPPMSSSSSPRAQVENIPGQSLDNNSALNVIPSHSVDGVIASNQSGNNFPAPGISSEHGGTISSSVKHQFPTAVGISHSPSDSDMDMEDDITHPDEEQQIDSLNLNHGSFQISSEQNRNEPLLASKSSAEHDLAEYSAGEEPSSSVFPSLEEQDQGPINSQGNDEFNSGKCSPKLDGRHLNLIREMERPFSSFTAITSESSSPHRDLIQPSASAELAGNSSGKLHNENTQGPSPFRLLQDYASDDDSDNSDENRRENVDPAAINPSVNGGLASIGANVNHNSTDGTKPKSLFKSRKGFDTLLEDQTDMKSNTVKKIEEMNDRKQKIHEFAKASSPLEVLLNPKPLRDDIIDGDSKSGAVQREDLKSTSGVLKVDEFGRLVREDHSDGGSGDSPRYTRRRGKRGRSQSRSRSPIRGRSRSRSRSPLDKRKRWSPRRRRERHGRSRSLSPKRRRSRSKSPSYRRRVEFGGDKMRRDKAPIRECFDFKSGKCYRGASCRYVHHEFDNTDRPRSYRSKQRHQDDPPASKSSDVYRETEAISPKRSVNERYEHENKDSKQDLPVTEEMKGVKAEPCNPTTQPCGNEMHTEPNVLSVTDAEDEKVHGNVPHHRPASFRNSIIQQPQFHVSEQLIDNTNYQAQQLKDDPSTQQRSLQTSATMQNSVPVQGPYLNQDPVSQSYAGLRTVDRPFASESMRSQSLVPELSPPVGNHSSRLPPSYPSTPQEASATFSQQMSTDYNLISKHSQFPLPSTTPWSSVLPPPPPPPPPLPLVNSSIQNTPGQYGLPPSQFQQNMLPPRSDFPYQASIRPYETEFPSVSIVGQQEMCSAGQEPYRSPYHKDTFGQRTLPLMNKPMGQTHGDLGPGAGDCFNGTLNAKSQFPQENLQNQRYNRPFPGDNLPPGPSSQIHPFMHQASLHAAPEGAPAHLGEPEKVIPSVSRHSSDNPERNQSSHLSHLIGSRISNHFNPYASTFDQLLSSEFGANIFTQEKDIRRTNKYSTPYNLGHAPADGLAAKRSLPAPANDQYDPLHDSIEPSSNSVMRPDSGHKLQVTDDSAVMLRMSGSNKLLDVEGNNKQVINGAVAGATSLENDEYGETADAEVGDVENGSPSNQHDGSDMAAGEVEIDQVKASGKTKKSKDSKSMKLFKIAIADFVKEVLKPSWRQGNMSKEAFKTIVKKTVDRVSGAMKSHQIPKSRAKIDRYIDSSQRKLTKLVMGYVDKYVKA